MSIYHIFDNATAAFTAPKAGGIVSATAGQVGQVTTYQGYTCTVTGTGAVSATVQPIASNDGVNWFNLGAAFTASGTGTATNYSTNNVTFGYFSAILTAITGTNASATCLLSI